VVFGFNEESGSTLAFLQLDSLFLLMVVLVDSLLVHRAYIKEIYYPPILIVIVMEALSYDIKGRRQTLYYWVYCGGKDK
jgi:hypothetical protein